METTLFQYAIRASSNFIICGDSFDGLDPCESNSSLDFAHTERHNTIGSSFFCTIVGMLLVLRGGKREGLSISRELTRQTLVNQQGGIEFINGKKPGGEAEMRTGTPSVPIRCQFANSGLDFR